MRLPAICVKTGLNRGAWSPEEDEILSSYIERHGHWRWGKLPKYAGLKRSGKSCRLRWLNYLRPDLKRGSFTVEEDELVHKLHEQFGNSWSKIAASLPGRSDNDIKNYWHTSRKNRSEPNAESEKATWKPKSVPQSSVLDDVAPIILETSGFGLVPPHKSYDFGNVWPELVELETMPQIFTSLPKPRDENAIASSGSNYNITSVLDFPMSPQNPEGIFSPFAASDEALVTKNQNTETVISAEPTSGIDGIDWNLLSQNSDMAFVLAEASLLPPLHPYEYPHLFYNGYA